MRLLTVVVASILLLGGCGGGGSAADAPAEVGRYLTGWSEARDDADAVRGLPQRMLVTDEDRLAELVALAGPELDTTTLEEVDLAAHVLVLGTYPRCDEHARVVRSPDGSALTIEVVEAATPVECAWSPVEASVWEVPRSALAEHASLEGPSRRD